MSGEELRVLAVWKREDVIRRFWSKVDKGPYCWTWLGHIGKARYGALSVDNRPVKAHRLAWMIANGEAVPVGLVVDHICRNTACVRPDHLRAVTQQENLLSGRTIVASQAARDECVNGHPFAGSNLHVRPNGDRTCVACRNESKRRRYAQRSPQPCPHCGVNLADVRRHVREIHEGTTRPSRLRAALDAQ